MKGSSTPPGFPAAVSCSPLRRSQRRRVRFAPATGDRLSCFGLQISRQAAPFDRGSLVLQAMSGTLQRHQPEGCGRTDPPIAAGPAIGPAAPPAGGEAPSEAEDGEVGWG